MSHTLEIRKWMWLVETLQFDATAFLRRLEAAQQLAARGASEGEKDAANGAIERMTATAKAVMPSISIADRRQIQRALGLPFDQADDFNGGYSGGYHPARDPKYWNRYKHLSVAEVLPKDGRTVVMAGLGGLARVYMVGKRKLQIEFEYVRGNEREATLIAAELQQLSQHIRCQTTPPGRWGGSRYAWTVRAQITVSRKEAIDLLTRGGFGLSADYHDDRFPFRGGDNPAPASSNISGLI